MAIRAIGFGAAAVMCAALATFAAQSAITVIGSSNARLCYLAAEHRQQLRGAIEACDAALTTEALSRRDRSATFVNRGIVRMQAEQFDRALQDFRSALEIDASLAEAHTNRGIAEWRKGSDKAAALASLTRGIELDTAEADVAHFYRALVNEDLGDLAAAYRDLQKAAELNPDWNAPQQELSRFKIVG
ncbi:tetratricopeptide repeat protein [Pacificimonas sp. WHA3]|uniref:Tetratricopeptide repeat protein n=1 Tax=Pacificimonas pallii TaxID=2827236 RepID=A0ABS6SDI8_9SPHN|nr:tetratricopeptide repeat protein [Pacificimonas pallii]MBV7255976.1 tetratricopeptide repeat protein [Pacificimonas pallii]